MHLLYIDDSGHPADPSIDWFVLSGISIFERQGFWFSQELDKIASRFNAANPREVELHGAEMRNGKHWRHIPPADRIQAIKDSLQILASSERSNRIFAAVVRHGSVAPVDPVEFAFEQLATRFDYYLQRLHRRNNTQRGLIIFDKNDGERRIQQLAQDFQLQGHRWGQLRNFAEVPAFMDSKASRLLQLADLVAYAIFRYYQHGDNQFFDIIKDRFDFEEGVQHGLVVRQ